MYVKNFIFYLFIHLCQSQNKNTNSNLFHCILFSYIKIKNVRAKKNNIT
jgi:hypothetical protein